MNQAEWVVQWSQELSRWECVTCGGISLSRDFDTLTHATDDAEVTRLRQRYLTAHGEAQDRFKKPNTLYHKTGCKFMTDKAETC